MAQAQETPQEFLDNLFEFNYCEECGGDAEHHTVCGVPGIGNYFARCDYPPTPETNWEFHPVIQEYRAKKETE